MNAQEYYRRVFPALDRSFAGTGHVLAAGHELAGHGWDAHGLLVSVEPRDQLWKLTAEWGLQAYLPVLGAGSERVLMPLDFEISLNAENHLLYGDRAAQRDLFRRYLLPVAVWLERFFRERNLAFLMDLTPSGGHILFWVERGTPAWEAVASIGHLEPDLAAAYAFRDPEDIKRRNGVAADAGLVFSGLGRLTEYIGYKLMEESPEIDDLPVTFCDSAPKSVNFDISWAGDPLYMRVIRSPFSLHRKNIEKYGRKDQPPLVDVLRSSWDGKVWQQAEDWDELLAAMWDLDRAAAHAAHWCGAIPPATPSLVDLVVEYKESGLGEFHRAFDKAEPPERGEALAKLRTLKTLSVDARAILAQPYPALLQPFRLRSFIGELVTRRRMAPARVGALVRDFYEDPAQKHWGEMNWFKNPSATKANFYARLFAGLKLWETDKLKV